MRACMYMCVYVCVFVCAFMCVCVREREGCACELKSGDALLFLSLCCISSFRFVHDDVGLEGGRLFGDRLWVSVVLKEMGKPSSPTALPSSYNSPLSFHPLCIFCFSMYC